MLLSFFLTLLFSEFPEPVLADLFTSSIELTRLKPGKLSLICELRDYLKEEFYRLHQMQWLVEKYANEVQISSELGEKDEELINPVTAFLEIRKMREFWTDLEQKMVTCHEKEFLQKLEMKIKKNHLKFASDDDLNGAAAAVFRIQDVYSIPTSNVAEGNLPSLKRRLTKLTSTDCEALGNSASGQKNYKFAAQWYEQALVLAGLRKTEFQFDLNFETAEQNSEKQRIRKLLTNLVIANCHEGQMKEAERFLSQLQNIANSDDNVTNALPTMDSCREMRRVHESRPFDSWTTSAEKLTEYGLLCKGELTPNAITSSQLFCYYKNNDPFLKIAPLKAELLHQQPTVILFRQVISDAEIVELQTIASGNISRSYVVGESENDTQEFAHYRISNSAYIINTFNADVITINKRAALMADLNVEQKERLQIAVYGLGGHYEPHFDFANSKLSQPVSGGYTVFPELRLGVPSSKNDALFWNNLHRNGEGDQRTVHAGCPVIAGHKWISNRWFHEAGQEFKRPCALNEWD